MKSILLSALVVLAAGAVFAQRPAGAGGPGGGRPVNIFGGDHFDAVTRLLQDPAALQTTLELTEAQATRLRELTAEVDAKIRVLDLALIKGAADQANLFAKALAEAEGDSGKELLELTKKINASTLERAELRVQRLLIIKQALTPAQITKAADLVKERAAKQAQIGKAVEDNDTAAAQRLTREMQGAGGPPGGRPGG